MRGPADTPEANEEEGAELEPSDFGSDDEEGFRKKKDEEGAIHVGSDDEMDEEDIKDEHSEKKGAPTMPKLNAAPAETDAKATDLLRIHRMETYIESEAKHLNPKHNQSLKKMYALLGQMKRECKQEERDPMTVPIKTPTNVVAISVATKEKTETGKAGKEMEKHGDGEEKTERGKAGKEDEPALKPAKRSSKSVQVPTCLEIQGHHLVGGVYTLEKTKYNDHHTWKNDENEEDLYIYCWPTPGPYCGWWLGLQKGGDAYFLFAPQPRKATEMPPQKNWWMVEDPEEKKQKKKSTQRVNKPNIQCVAVEKKRKTTG